MYEALPTHFWSGRAPPRRKFRFLFNLSHHRRPWSCVKKAQESREEDITFGLGSGAARQWCWDIGFHSSPRSLGAKKEQRDRFMGSGSLRAKGF